MAGRTRLWGRLSLTTAVIASLFVAAGPGHEAGATYPGANGRIVFGSASHGGFWTVTPDGTGARKIFPAGNAWPHFSPDGTKVAARVGGEELWVVNADGTNPRQIPATAPDCNGVYGTTWSPDGTKIAFGKQCGSVFPTFVTNVDGSGEATRLTTFSASYPAWSPDGTKIAFTASTKIWVMNADGTNPVQLTPDYENSDVEWAPDSARLIFSRRGPGDTGRRVYVMNRDGTGLTAVTPNDGLTDFEPVFSPDGTRIAFVEGEHLKVMDADGSNVTEIAPVIDGVPMRASSPDWGVGTPPGEGIEFAADAFDGSEDGGNTRLLQGAVITVVRTGSTAGTATMLFATSDGTAKSSSSRKCLRCTVPQPDYLKASGTLVFGDGETTKRFVVPIIDDGVIENDETVNLTLKRAKGGALPGPRSTAVLTIHDNDPNVSFQHAASSGSEAVGVARLKVLLSSPVSGATVDYSVTGGTATAGEDYTLAAGTLGFGARSPAIPLTVIDDDLKEQPETVVVELSTPTNAELGPITTHTFTIIDDDPQGDVAGDTPATALAVDLVAQPRQVIGESLSPNDVDVYRVHLEAGDDLVVDVDPVGTIATRLRSSTLTILGSDGTSELAVVGGSKEPDGTGSTGNPAHLFHAEAAGDYYVRLSTGFGRYRIELHRLAVAEGVQDPRVLDQEGPMFAWLRGDTLGITGPTGYGFTLQGAWTKTTTAPLRNGTRSTVYTLARRQEVDLVTAFGELRLQVLADIVVSTEPNRWGDVFGIVGTEEIPLPMGIPLDELETQFRDQFGLDMSVSALEKWTITMGSDIVAGGRGRPPGIRQVLPGIPYLLFYDRPAIAATFGPVRINKNALEEKVLLILDPVDPFLYIRANELGGVKDPTLAFSRRGYLPFHAELEPTIPEAAGVTNFYSHVFASIGIPPIPAKDNLTVFGDGSVDVDANDDGTWLAGEGNAHQLFNGDLSAFGEVFRDINLGANAKVIFRFDKGPFEFEIPLGRASAVYNGQQERFWFRGNKGAEQSPLAGTPFRFLDMTQQDFIEGTIRSDGRFSVLGGTRVDLPGDGLLLVQLDLDNEGIEANVRGTIEFSGSAKVGGATASCKAIAGAGGLLAFSYSGGSLHMSGSLKTDGRVRCYVNGNPVASASFDLSGRIDDGKILFRLPYIGEKSIRLF